MSVVYVHIGLPKTGTTHLQDRLWRNRDLAMRSSGLLYPGDVISDHFHAAVHLQPERYLDWVDPNFARKWPTLLAQIKAWPQTSLLSHELYATATPEHIAKLMDDLSFADEVHVIATVRDLARQLPSVWQENVKNQHPATFDDFLTSVHQHGPALPGFVPPADAGVEEPFWEFQDYTRILADWAQAVGTDRVHVVTVPTRRDTPGDSLWERFLRVLDVDPGALTIPVPNLNSSLDASQADLVRQLNHRLQPSDVEWRRYERVVKGEVIGQILFKSRSGAPLALAADQRGWVAQTAGEMNDALREAGYRVSGDLADLAVSPESTGDASAPDAQQILDVALDTMAEMIKRAPLPPVGPRWQTRAMNVVRRIRRRALGVRRSL
ncbi:sulfotransferase family protein [Gordonia sp. SID5947]|uniref:sulfotransferase family protein n=1 Tax=Gordonia sp. SID5947 TaxID=2690315 RepID=UPI00136ED4E3|nr:sulfotransferase family protein [Gordonia sp. SID5947]MYR05070.1 sulfotransferase family protein [Gordonia sp. SID5947]